MDLNVKLYGLKYNYEKSSGVFLQNSEVPAIFGIYGIIFLNKNP
jgi:hypothetical protein